MMLNFNGAPLSALAREQLQRSHATQSRRAKREYYRKGRPRQPLPAPAPPTSRRPCDPLGLLPGIETDLDKKAARARAAEKKMLAELARELELERSGPPPRALKPIPAAPPRGPGTVRLYVCSNGTVIGGKA